MTAIGQAASYGWEDLAELLALITVNLGIFSLLLPFLALDGGRWCSLLIEAVTGHAVPEKIQSSSTLAAFCPAVRADDLCNLQRYSPAIPGQV